MSPLIRSRDLAADRFSSSELARMVRAGELTRVRRGAYAVSGEDDLEPTVVHLRLLEATMPQCDPTTVVSHTSAAVVHGLPVWNEHLARTRVTRDREGGG